MAISDNIRAKFATIGVDETTIYTLNRKPLHIRLVNDGVEVILRSTRHTFHFEDMDAIERRLGKLLDHRMLYGNSVMYGHKDHLGEIGYGLGEDTLNGFYGIHALHKGVGQVPMRVANHLGPILDWGGGIKMNRGIRGSGIEANITLI